MGRRFGPAYDPLWEAMRQRLGDSAGTRALIEVLLLHRSHSRQAVDSAVGEAVQIVTCGPDTVALLGRRFGTESRPEALPLPVGVLEHYDRPVLETASYDDLLAVTR